MRGAGERRIGVGPRTENTQAAAFPRGRIPPETPARAHSNRRLETDTGMACRSDWLSVCRGRRALLCDRRRWRATPAAAALMSAPAPKSVEMLQRERPGAAADASRRAVRAPPNRNACDRGRTSCQRRDWARTRQLVLPGFGSNDAHHGICASMARSCDWACGDDRRPGARGRRPSSLGLSAGVRRACTSKSRRRRQIRPEGDGREPSGG